MKFSSMILQKFKIALVFIILNIVCFSFVEGQSPCDLPTNVGKKEISDHNILISWKINTPVDYYEIRWRRYDQQYDDQHIVSNITNTEVELSDLQPATKYFYSLKAVCSSGESNWSAEYNFTTELNNPSSCSLNLPIKDYDGIHDIIGKTYFKINQYNFGDRKLGVDLFIQNIKLIISHSWTSDLELNITSPGGKKINLISNLKSVDTDGLGNPNDETCTQTLNLSDEACKSIEAEINSFTGDFLPVEHLSNLYDGNSPVGDWELEIIDQYIENSGLLKYFEIEFAPILCPIPQNISITPVNDTEAQVDWKLDTNVENINLFITNQYGTSLLTTPNEGSILLTNLNSSSLTSVSMQSKCANNISTVTCPILFQTLCNVPSLREQFDDQVICNDPCYEDCLNSNLWYNNASGKNLWIVHEGKTITENTGPDSDVYGFGKYIYIESSQNGCYGNDTVAVLQSQCLKLENTSGCDMSFYYNMYGIDIDKLILEITTDGGNTWTELFRRQGNQDRGWKRMKLDLTAYEGKICNLRFVGSIKKDKNFGDIGLDDIIMYNAVKADNSLISYYADIDKDGYGRDSIPIIYCSDSFIPFVKNNLDCNDNDPAINPEATEIKCNLIDENCNGMNDDVDIPIVVNDVIKVNETCNGKGEGSIALVISGGYPPYIFNWSNGVTDSLLTNLHKGIYWCTITDQSGCGLVTPKYSLDYNSSINFAINALMRPTCGNKNDGAIDISVNANEEIYKYLWNTGDTIQDLSGLNAGKYNVTITDTFHCIFVSDTIDLYANTAFNIATLHLVNPSCEGFKNGSIEIKPFGGTPPFTYLWNNSNTTETMLNLTEGNYFCTVTDGQNCVEVFGPVVLKDPKQLKVNFNYLDNVTCIGQENGNIELSVSGGTFPYSYLWTKESDGDFVSLDDDIYNLSAGYYDLRVTDDNGCQIFIDSVEIKTLDSLSIALNQLNPSKCSNSTEGYISIIPTGGYRNYHFYWSTGIQQQDFIDSLTAGLYSVTVTDDLGCKSVLNNIDVKNLNIPLNVTISQIDTIRCFGDKSAGILAIVDSKNPPFDFNWNSGIKKLSNEPNDTIDGLGNGDYNVTVTDNSGCVGTSIYLNLSQPSALNLKSAIVKQIDCFGDSNGSIDLSPEGGVPPYKYNWNVDSIYTKKLSKLDIGKYYATITDQNGCSVTTDTIMIVQPDSMKVEIISIAAHAGQNDGSAILLISGGIWPYEIKWDNNANNQTGDEATNLKSGWYNVTISDYNYCSLLLQVYINEITVSTEEHQQDEIIVYPNPASKNVYVLMQKPNKNIEIELFDLNSVKQNIETQTFNENKIKLDLSYIQSGFYFLRIKSEDKYITKKLTIIK